MVDYTENETMELLGKQTLYLTAVEGGVARTDFRNVLDAHRAQPKVDVYDVGMDFFMLGLIYGKKMERAHRNRTEVEPISTTRPGGKAESPLKLTDEEIREAVEPDPEPIKQPENLPSFDECMFDYAQELQIEALRLRDRADKAMENAEAIFSKLLNAHLTA